MSNRSKIAVFFVILLLFLSLGATSFYYLSFFKEKEKSQELTKQLSQAQDEQKKIEIKLKQINEERNSLVSKIKENQGLIAKLNDKLAEEIKAKELMKQEQEILRKEIVEITDNKKSIEESLSEKLKEIDVLKGKLNTTVLKKAELEEEIKALSVEEKDVVDLEKIVVVPTESSELEAEAQEGIIEAKESSGVELKKAPEQEIEEFEQEPSLSGGVLLINKEYNFLVIDVGEADGVEQGEIFELSRESVPLGQVRIEKVHQNMSAANFLPGLIVSQIREGDVANRID